MGDQTLFVKLSLMFSKVKAYLGIVSLQFGYAGMYIITMVSLKHGMNHYVLVVYRHAVATLVIAPFALVLERKVRPKMTLSTFLKIMVLGFLEPVFDQNLYYVGMKYTSATFASATVNVLPAITFIMAIIFRLEKINIKKIPSQAKVIGTLITVTGAMVMTLYKGPIIDFIHTRGISHHESSSDPSAGQNWATGTLMLLGGCFGWSGFFILQSFTLKQYPAELSLTALICFMGTVQGAAVALVMERDKAAWAIGFDSRILAAAYSGIVCSGIAYYVQSLVIKERGPVFVTAFSPLCMIITAALGSFILAEKLHLGSILGAAVIVVGLYSVVWGKSKEARSSASQAPTDEKAGGSHELPVASSTKPSIVHNNNMEGDGGMLKIRVSEASSMIE
ncbi:WAT1-related protein [Vitis vinifera]|uniref:WAT1-related protein n=1 Tax=Vitis vinifera TaxID=29760 RepID=A0A438KMY9_VITVI|nr:WAT1-related protein [Vitis vinifera]